MGIIRSILPVPEPGPVRQLITSSAILNLGAGLQEVLIPFFLLAHCFASLEVTGIVLSITALGALIAVVPAGYLCEKIPARNVVFLAGSVQAVATLGLIITNSIPVVAVVLCVCTVMAQVSRIARSSMVAGMPVEKRTVARAQMSVWSNLGVGAGMALTVVFLSIDTRWAFNLGFIVTAACFFFSAHLRRRSFQPKDILKTGGAGTSSAITLASLTNKRLISVSAAHLVLYFHQVLLTVGVSLWVAADDRLPNWLAGLTLVVNLLIAIAAQNTVAMRIKTPAHAIKAWAVAFGIAGSAIAIFAVATSYRLPVQLTIAAILLTILLLSLAELWYVAGEMEMSVLFAAYDGSASAQAVFLLGRDIASVIGPLGLTLLISHQALPRWFVIIIVFVAFACGLWVWASTRSRRDAGYASRGFH